MTTAALDQIADLEGQLQNERDENGRLFEERKAALARATAAEGERDKWRDIAERPGHHFAEYARRLTEWAERWTAADARAKAAEGERDALRAQLARTMTLAAERAGHLSEAARRGDTNWKLALDEQALRTAAESALAEARGREKALREELALLKAGPELPSGFVAPQHLKYGGTWGCTHGDNCPNPITYGCPECCAAGCAEHPNEPHDDSFACTRAALALPYSIEGRPAVKSEEGK